MKSTCHICGSATNYLLEKDTYKYNICQKCGLVFVFPQPTTDFLTSEVYSEKSGYQKSKTKNISLIKPNKKQSELVNKIVKICPTGSILDIGCSSGELLYFLKGKGLKVKGVEPNKTTADIAVANGIDVTNGYLSDANFNENEFDCIILGDVIEHTTDPKKFISECKKILKPGGFIIIGTPNLNCFWAKSTFQLFKLFNIPWSPLTPPHHLFQFSENNLVLMVESDGFKKHDIWFSKRPPLKYELGSLHLYKNYKNKKNIQTMFYMLFSFSIYTIVFIIDNLLTPFKSRDFSVNAIFIKK